jgi:hypothetical protein
MKQKFSQNIDTNINLHRKIYEVIIEIPIKKIIATSSFKEVPADCSLQMMCRCKRTNPRNMALCKTSGCHVEHHASIPTIATNPIYTVASEPWHALAYTNTALLHPMKNDCPGPSPSPSKADAGDGTLEQ